MTCYRQKRFDNPIKPENRGNFDKFTIHGKCNNCPGCAKQKQNDWLVRSYYEYMSQPHDCFFVTLDFDDQNLPRYKGKPCFDSEIVKRFFESLRQSTPPFRYLISSHLGDALGRPHYHVAFLFKKNSFSLDEFWKVLPRIWHYGSHSDISLLRSVRSPLAAFEYICRYTTFSYKVKQYFKEMPYRYQPHTTASIGFGAQCLDPAEIPHDRLLKQGVVFNKVPSITRDYILHNNLVYLDIKDDGILVPFSIPSYYEQKLMFDYSYDSVEKKVNQVKNKYGLELQKIRHNSHYNSLYDEFINSKSLKIHEDHFTSMVYHEVFPNSPYQGVAWSDIVNDVTSDKEKFYDFCKFYNWLKFDTSLPGFYRYRPLGFGLNSKNIESHPMFRFLKFSLHGRHFYAPALDGSISSDFDDCGDNFIYAMSYYHIWKDIERRRCGEFEDWKLQESIKQKIKQKAKNDINFYWHLRRKNFKFYTLNPSSYVSRYQIRQD